MHVLVPIDDSEPAHAAVEYALEQYPNAEITALHVVDPSMSVYHGDSSHSMQRLLALEEENAATLFEDVEAIAAEYDASITTETTLGMPIDGIVEYAEDHDVDSIVIGSHRRSGVSRVLLGSVAEQVVRRAPMPVTVAR
ncbi:universal stress protein [Natronolimnohabitans innermongolicus]|uniref:UspA domain-containing protein n=1 Tax=Natronolimnohabitans innermongolicus JCM 12255 TaxID=1227499 RepID=L9WH53_9EURY|nr:universal stress protein [Natronolimnohabitans innermongolicus]ELY48561.1 UspA domain-containing protein [Natronolimnohabitans innermongolicus JCM 12255]